MSRPGTDDRHIHPTRTVGPPVAVPPGLDDQRRLGPDWGRWLDLLPGRVAGLLDAWTLTVDGAPAHGFCSLVIPVRTDAGRAAVLKVAFDADEESEHEALALRLWDGDGTVRLLRDDPSRRALLLERLHRRDLTTGDPLEACRVIAAFYGRIHRPAPPEVRPLTAFVARWLDDLATCPAWAPIPRDMIDCALAVGRELIGTPDAVGTLIHGDLHYENVLAADREPWLVIDPKPMSGDPHYEPAPVLWNRWADLEATGDVPGTVRRRLAVVVEVAGLDPGRARDWVVVRMVLNAWWSVQDALRMRRALDADERTWIARCLVIATAVDPP